MKVHKLAGIDIGSNSVRLLVSNVIADKKVTLFKKSSLTRLPIRLGADSFQLGKISKKNIDRLVTGMQAYAHIMQVHGVEQYRACATSAMREASNGEEVVRKVFEETGINIELIDGKEEAKMIFNSDMILNIQDQEDSFLYIDVGGGSTELTLFFKQQIVASKSFKIGTIRLLKGMVVKEQWDEMKHWIKEHTKGMEDILMVGSGGNINRTFKMSDKKEGHPLSINYLENTYNMLNKFSAQERMVKFDLNPDRADVITHALRIYTSAMNWAHSERMLVPKKGLADGIVRYLFREQLS
jgi:exopolyphosphatase/guanosine-5'-triphosphate,3'-diphosphate pyrophosphatase